MTAQAALELKNISKRFAGVQALSNIDFTLHPGEIHALVGENGAGKSTLIKIISGAHQPDAGTIFYRSQPVTIPHPHRALEMGIAVIYQETSLYPDLSVLENLFMGRQPRRRLGLVDWPQMRALAQKTLDELEMDIPLDQRAGQLGPAQQQKVEIAKALSREAQVLIMDEPTAALTKKDTDTLFHLVRRLKARGVGVIYISHRLEEVFQLADRVTVLRDSQLIHTGPVAEVDQQTLIRHMVGRTLDTLYPKELAPIGEVLLETKNLRRSSVLHDISLTVRRGEIVSLAGLVGSGRSEVARAIFGIDPVDGGQILLRGRVVRITSPQQAIALGLAYVPEDRQHQGLVLPMAVGENMTLAVLRSLCRWGFVQRLEEDALAQRYVDQLSIRTPGVRTPARTLSGGNQQKVVLAKWLASSPQVLILDEPTRGVDVGAKAEIHRLMSELAKRGLGMLMISSELPEVLGMADRVLVMYRGRLAGELSRAEATQEEIIALATGAA